MENLLEILQKWEPVIGLEVHAQLSTDTKMFCGCKNAFGDPPNTHVCPVCLGLPGSLPVANEKAIEYALKLGLALGSEITRYSRFARKNYFYPDLPKGYQISQYEEPLCNGGSATIRQNGKLEDIPLIRIHLEEDAGKSIHSENGEGTRIDFNRCGVPLVEIVSAPVIKSPQEARRYLIRLKQVLQYLDICDCNMEEGNLRCDANISLRAKGETGLGIRTEMKNMNSFRSVERGLTYEIVRQAKILEEGGKIEAVTLFWNETEQRAEIMRTKEEAHDYRYFPDPDLVPIVISDEQLSGIQQNLVELPHEMENRFAEFYGLRMDDVVILVSDIHLANYYEDAIRLGGDPLSVSKWILGVMLRILKNQSMSSESFPIGPDRLVELLKAVESGLINRNTAKVVYKKMLTIDKSPTEIIETAHLAQISNSEKLQSVIDEVITGSPEEVLRYRGGKKSLLGYFMGRVMRRTGGKSDPGVVRKLLKQSLED